MISLKKYLDAAGTEPEVFQSEVAEKVLPAAISAYRSALAEMGNSSLDVCPSLGIELKRDLDRLEAGLESRVNAEAVEATDRAVTDRLKHWSLQASRQNRQTTGQVKELLLVMARTAEAVGERDQRCAGQLELVTKRLEKIRSLEDLSQIRASIAESAAELKSSVDRIAAEGKAAVKQLRVEVAAYQARLEEAEETASRDALTGLRNRPWVERQIERRIATEGPLCLAIVDIDGFKKVNDVHGHLVGDELLRMFATELKAACRPKDFIGRWGGDEFILVLDCGIQEATIQVDRLAEWVCGAYTLKGKSGSFTYKVDASIGVAERKPRESMKGLLARADASMYERKKASQAKAAGARR